MQAPQTTTRRPPSRGRLPAAKALRRAIGPVALGLPVALWQLCFFVLPLGFLGVVTFWQVRNYRLQPAFILDNWERILGSSAFQRAFIHTFSVASTATVLALVFAWPAAQTIALRLSPRARDRWIAFLILPVFSSYILKIYAWQVVLSPQGILNSLLIASGLPAQDLLGGALSLQIGYMTLTLPIVILILTFALIGLDRSLIEAARNLGCNGPRLITSVLIPATRPGIVFAASTAFLLTFGDYGSPVFLTGSNPPTLSILIVDTIKSGSQWPRASVIGVMMLALPALAFLGLAFARRLLKKGQP
ncbi:ABC transporter permease [Albirhodobacter sp. R86504]|uniref:ABC transporter permease n=1 Tax=Albirhodobacter sp. R86504 TaxID=3093848 RepID=UPI00366B881C